MKLERLIKESDGLEAREQAVQKQIEELNSKLDNQSLRFEEEVSKTESLKESIHA